MKAEKGGRGAASCEAIIRSWARWRVAIAAVTLATSSLVPRVAFGKINANEVPFKLYRGYAIVVRGSIGNLKNLNFLVDTGAVPSVVDQRLADRLHLAGTAKELSVFTQKVAAKQVTIKKLQLGPAHADSLLVVIRDLSFAGVALGTRIDAMIGFDFLSQSAFVIDYEFKKLVFGPIDTSLMTLPYRLGPGYVAVEMRIQQKIFLLLVDTGANDLVLFGAATHDCADAITTVGSRTWSNMGGEIEVMQVQLKDGHLGSMAWSPDAFVLEVAEGAQPSGLSGLLGVASLKARRVGFDPTRQVLVVEQ